MMRVSGRPRTLLTPLISWIPRVNLSREMPSCPFPQVLQLCRGFCYFRDSGSLPLALTWLHFLQVAGCVSERAWLRWSSSSSSPTSFSAFASPLHLEFLKMNWTWRQLWASSSLLHLMSCVPSVASEEEEQNVALWSPEIVIMSPINDGWSNFLA